MTAPAPGTSRAARGRSLLGTMLSTDPSSLGTDIAAVAVRIVLVWIFIYYGAGKLFGAFDGPGIHQTSLFMASTAHLHPGGLFAVVAGVIELGGALALAIGVASRFAAVALFVDQVIAVVTVTWAHGLSSSTATGYELNLALAAMALVIVGIGAGRPSLDAIIGRRLRARSDGARADGIGAVPPGDRLR
jgi:putative oxidoreductase